MKKHKQFLAAMAAVMLLVLGVSAQESTSLAAAQSQPRHLYLVVLDPSRGADPLDVVKHGGNVEFEAGDRLAIRLPEAALEGIIRNQRVRYIQRLVQGDETAARLAPAVRADASAITHTGASWTTGTYAYDGSGNVTAVGPNSDGVTNRFSYDPYGRLTTSNVHVGAVAHPESYEYDRFGNLQARTTDGTRVSLPVDPATNRAQGGARYDAAGNQTYDPLWGDLTYDAAGMMTSRGYATLYAYDANDERVVQVQNYGGGNTRWRWTPRDLTNQVTREWESFGRFGWEYPVWINDYVSAGGQLLVADREEAEGGERHFHVDHLGTPRYVTNAEGEIVSSHVLRPFGAEITSTTQEQAQGYANELTRRFTGHERDYGAAGTSLDYMHARYYNAPWGRFLSGDPTWKSADLNKPQTWNRYSYVLNNPIRYTDPDGRCTNVLDCTLEGGAVAGPTGAVVGAAVGVGLVYVGSKVNWRAVGDWLVSGGGSSGEVAAEQTVKNWSHQFESKDKPGSTSGPKGRPSKTVQQQAADETRDANGQVRCANCLIPTSEPGAKPKTGESKGNADHIVPSSKGGDKTIDNIQWTCETCNKSAQDDPQPKTTGADKLRPPM